MILILYVKEVEVRLIKEIIIMKLFLIYIVQFMEMTLNQSNLLSVFICVSLLFRSRCKDSLVQANSRSFTRIAFNSFRPINDTNPNHYKTAQNDNKKHPPLRFSVPLWQRNPGIIHFFTNTT